MNTSTTAEKAAATSLVPEKTLSYILVVHGESGDPSQIGVYDDPIARNRATMRAIYGGVAEPHQEAELSAILECLAEEKWFHFEGDPPLQWIDAATNLLP